MKIRVLNMSDGESVTYPMPLLTGEVEEVHQDGFISASSSGDPDGVVQWPVIDGQFKVLVRLQVGKNLVHLQHGLETVSLTVNYELPGFTHIVRPVYIVCSDDDGYFQGPETADCSPTSASKRISFGAAVIQTLTAEKMIEQGFGRRTFQVETDSEDFPTCHVFKSKLRLEEAYSKTGYELWSFFGKELMTSPLFSHKSCSKFYCFMSFTRYHLPKGEDLPKTHSEILKHTRGHTALGGGGLALFGTGNLHTWADNLASFNACLTNRTRIDRRRFMDDSAYREYYWANYATGLGASLHELGHTFDLAHTPSGIMARGFDDLHKVFVVQYRRRGRLSMRSERKQRQRYNSGGSSNSEISRTPSTSSIEDTSPSLGSSSESSGGAASAEMNILNATIRRKTDVCYGSPYKQTFMYSVGTSIAPPPLVFQMEVGFKQAAPPTTVTFSVQNYDGGETTRTVSEGINTKQSSRRRVGLGTEIKDTSSCTTCQPHVSSDPSTLVSSSDEPSPAFDLTAQPEVDTAVVGAHWYRSSAVILRFHKWFNKPHLNDNKKSITLQGACIRSVAGVRVVELRTDPEGCVFHHWEFLDTAAPVEFLLRQSEVTNLPANIVTFTVLAEDSCGHILKRKMNVQDLY